MACVSEGDGKLQDVATAFFRQLLSIAVLVFSVSTMLSVGLGHTVRHVFGPMRDARAVIRALLANFVLVPLLAFGLSKAMPLDSSYETGLMLFATAAGAPFLIPLTRAAGGNVALSASLTMLLLPITVIYMPLVVPLVAPDARVSPAAIALPLIVTMILPLAAGLMVRAWHAVWAERLRPWFGKLATIALLTSIVSTIVPNLGGIVRVINDGAIFAPLLVILGAFVIGYALGREYRGGHVVLGLGAAQRNIAAALVVATQGLNDPAVVVIIVAASLLELALLFPIAWALRRRGLRRGRMAHA
jgi:BASS family bile acid:Na+ symporter